jgi:hypothetical protein
MGISGNKLIGLGTVAFLLVSANAGNAFATGSWTINNKQPALNTAPTRLRRAGPRTAEWKSD